MCSLNQLYLTAEQHAHSTPRVCELAQGPFAPDVGSSDAGGHRVRELASSPLAQLAPLGGVGADTGLMGRTRQTGAYQTACDHNQQWRRTMNAIIYKNTVQVSFSRSPITPVYSHSPFAGAAWAGCDPVSIVVGGTFFHRAQGYPAIHALSPSGPIRVQLQPLYCKLHSLARGQGRPIKPG